MKFHRHLKNRIIIFALLLISGSVYSQELDCRVVVNSDRVQTLERRVFDDMETSFTEFFNTRKWTEDEYNEEERIKCNLIINIQEIPAIGSFKATVQIISARPVFGTNYQTVVFNFADRDWTFEYVEGQPLIFNENTFNNNISSLLGFYGYVILGYDYDTFSPKGGDVHFQKAWQVVTSAQQSGYPGWEQFNSTRNRYWLAENLISPQLLPVRELQYDYHIKGLDVMHEKPEDGRKAIAKSLAGLKTANGARPRSIVTLSFLDSKTPELTKMFSEGEIGVRRNVYNTLINIDPSLSEKIKPIIEN